MAVGRSAAERQEELFIAHDRLPKSVGHVFYQRLNKLLWEADDAIDPYAAHGPIASD